MKKEVVKYIVVFFSLILVFLTYSVLVSLLPTQNIKKNITRSINAMLEEGCYPYGMIQNKHPYRMDNFTDALILSQNYSIDNKRPFHSSINTCFATYPDTEFLDGVKRQVDSEDVLLNYYARYWHGNTFLLRPFLLFADYSFIRWILYAVSSILLLILGIKLFQTIGMKKTIACFSGLFFVNIFITQFSIQLFPVLCLSAIACILVCKHFKDRKKILLISFIFGCLTAYLDLLSTPLFTCGLPLIVYLLAEEENIFRKRLLFLVLFVGLWGIGYGFTWTTKWVLGTLFTDINIFEDAFRTISIRAGSGNDFTRLDAIIKNFHLLPIVTINFILVFLLVLSIIFFNKKAIKTNLLLLIVAALPYLWFLVVSEHSVCHWWFTYRVQAISIAAIFIIFINFISWDKIDKLIHKRNIFKPNN